MQEDRVDHLALGEGTMLNRTSALDRRRRGIRVWKDST